MKPRDSSDAEIQALEALCERLAGFDDRVSPEWLDGCMAALLAGPRELIQRASRHRRRLGGAMRQIGIFAAAALHGVAHHRSRLAEDHANARRLAARLAACAAVQLDLATVQTNIIVFHLRADAPDAAAVVAQARAQGVLLAAFGPRTVRAVTHLDVSAAQCDDAAQRLAGPGSAYCL